MLDHEVLQVWMWDIYLIGAHLFHWDTPGRVTEWAWNTSNTPCWKGDAEGVDVILEVKRVWMCWSILPAFRFPKFSVCVVFVNMNNMLACFLYRWTTLLNLDEQLCWIFGPPRSCAGARKSLVFKVEENNMSMNMLVTVLHWVYGNSLDRTLSVFCCTLPLSLSMVQLILQQLLRQLLWQLS